LDPSAAVVFIGSEQGKQGSLPVVLYDPLTQGAAKVWQGMRISQAMSRMMATILRERLGVRWTLWLWRIQTAREPLREQIAPLTTSVILGRRREQQQQDNTKAITPALYQTSSSSSSFMPPPDLFL
jgi:hypothetical protein